MNLGLWFQTAIYWQDLPNAKELNADHLKHIKEWYKKDKGLQKTNRGGWHSSVDMQTREEYKPLVNELLCMQNGICKEEGYTSQTMLGNMWANINFQGCYNKDHIHPNSHWSGVYYIQTPEDCGHLHIEDPRAGSNMMMPKQLPKNKIPQRLWTDANFQAIAGRMIMFPAFLNHGVEVNNTKEEGEQGWRISVSFNFVQR